MTEREAILESELAEKNRQLAETSAELAKARQIIASYESHDTMPPSNRDEPTGDHSRDVEQMTILLRLDGLESRESIRAGEIQDLIQRVDGMLERTDRVLRLAEQQPVVDPEALRELTALVRSLPCLPKGTCPEHEPLHLASVAPSSRKL